jgi:hypothetical protein
MRTEQAYDNPEHARSDARARTQHAQAPQRGDGGGQVLLGVVQLLDVAANLLHHGLRLVCFGLDFDDVPVQLLSTARAVLRQRTALARRVVRVARRAAGARGACVRACMACIAASKSALAWLPDVLCARTELRMSSSTRRILSFSFCISGSTPTSAGSARAGAACELTSTPFAREHLGLSQLSRPASRPKRARVARACRRWTR